MDRKPYTNLSEAYRKMFESPEKPSGAYPVPVPFRTMRPVQVHKTNVEIDVTQPYVGPGGVEKAYYTYPAGFDPTNREDVVKDQKYDGSEARPEAPKMTKEQNEIRYPTEPKKKFSKDKTDPGVAAGRKAAEEMGLLKKEEIEIVGDYLMEAGLVDSADQVDSFFSHMSDEWKSHIIEVACWDTHKKVGMKKKGGKMVNDCVPK